MSKVRIIAGTYGRRVNGVVKPVRVGECCEVSTGEAARLVKLGVAEFVTEPEAAVVVEEETAEPEEPATDYPDLTVNELRRIAKDRGITGTAHKTKSELVELLMDFDAEADDEEPPELSAEVPQ